MAETPVTQLLILANSLHRAGAHDAVGAEHDHLASPEEARSYLAEAGLDVPPDPPSDPELGRLRELRDLAHDVLDTPEDHWRARLGELSARHLFRFERSGRLTPAAAGWDGLTASLVPQLFELERIRPRLRHCANPACRWLFVDRSKNHSRVWCDMASCGSRAKMSRYRSRRAGSATALTEPPRGMAG